MVEPLAPPTPPERLMPAVEPDEALARKNNRWAWLLVLLFLLLFGGTFLVAEAYLWLS